MKVQEINTYTVLLKDEKILVLKRKNGIWEFPGGKIEWGETPRDSAVRETKEESGITPAELKFVGITSATYKKEEEDKHSVYLVYFGRTNESDVVLSREHMEYRWLSLNEVKYLKLGLNAEHIPDLIESLLEEE